MSEVQPVEHIQDVTNTCVRCELDYIDCHVHIIDGEGAVCINCLTKEECSDALMSLIKLLKK